MSPQLTVAKEDMVKCQVESGKFLPKSAIGARSAVESPLEKLTVIVVAIANRDGITFQPATVHAKLRDGSRIPTYGVIKAIQGRTMIFSCFTRKDGSWSAPPGNPVTPVAGYQGPDSSFGSGPAQFAFAFPAEIVDEIVSIEVE